MNRDELTPEEILALLFAVLSCGLSKMAAAEVAADWIATRLRASKRPSRSVAGLKAEFEHAHRTRYVPMSAFRAILAQRFKISRTDRVYCRLTK